MYIPEIYKNENIEEIYSFMHENGFAILVNILDGKPWATHIPLVLENTIDGKRKLVGHISKDNPQGNSLTNQSEVLAIFSGVHAYISSSWYDHENVPTWNYSAVHVYGEIQILSHDEAIKSLEKLVDKYEKKSKKPIKVANLSEKTMQQAKGIIAFEIEITSISAVHKMSQNRDDLNYNSIITELEKTNDFQSKLVAIEMKKCPR